MFTATYTPLKDSITLPIPADFIGRQIEIHIVPLPTAEQNPKLTVAKSNLESMLHGSLTESLTGILTDNGSTLDDYRLERLNKYECTN